MNFVFFKIILIHKSSVMRMSIDLKCYYYKQSAV